MLAIYLALMEDESDEAFFAQIYEGYQQQMWFVANAVLRDEHLAEDAVQEAFLSVAKNIKVIRNVEKAKFRSYMLTCAKNAAIDISRKENKFKACNIDDLYDIFDEKAEEQMEAVFREKTVIEILDMLKPKYRDILYLRFVLNRSEKEISEALDMKINTVRQQIFRGKNMLRKLYEEAEKDESKL